METIDELVERLRESMIQAIEGQEDLAIKNLENLPLVDLYILYYNIF